MNESDWLRCVVAQTDGYEAEAVQRFTNRLIRLAQSRLPHRLNRRVDPEDIVQSVFNSFFQRNRNGQFEFKTSNDLWRLLAAMTYHKVMATVEFHGRQRRNFTREVGAQASTDPLTLNEDRAANVSAIAIMAELLEQILDQLPPVHQHILQLRLEDYSIAEIADRVEVSTRTVNRALKNARSVAERIVANGR